jgi:sterol desaturase/sphingolipid hydroxylase (fatty acid hydroxylase superfamily)
MTQSTVRRSLTLAQASRTFWRYPSPWLLAAAFSLALAARIATGDWRISDAAVPLVLALVFPFFEWSIHVLVLHWCPRTFASVAVDPMLARKHREHHANPRDIGLIFIPMQSLIGAVVSATAVALLLFPRTGLGLTFLVLILGVGLAYEWTHYLVHTDYRPKTRAYRFLWRNHRLHHFKNEHYWFAVTTPGTADRVLGTYPDPQAVETSATARTVHAVR